MRCRTAQTWIVAARDGELGARQRHALDRHLNRCAQCRAARVSTEDVLAALDRMPQEASVPARLEAEVMRRVRGLDDATARRYRLPASRWLTGVGPALAATAVVGIAVVGLRSGQSPVPETRLRATTPAAPSGQRPAVARRAKRAPVDPPAALASRPDLFVDLPMLRELDKLQHFDSIATMEDNDATAPDGEPSPSNG